MLFKQLKAFKRFKLRKPDGLSFTSINTSSLFATAGGNEAIKFELQRFIWVG